jgi:gas vesicle protein
LLKKLIKITEGEMNEENRIVMRINSLIIGFVLGVIAAGITAGFIFAGNSGRSAGEIAELNRQRDQLDREYFERQSFIDDNQRIVGELVTECIGYVETARAITERTGANAGAAVSDLRAASNFIRQGIEEREALKMELNNLRSGLYRLGNVAGVDAE